MASPSGCREGLPHLATGGEIEDYKAPQNFKNRPIIICEEKQHLQSLTCEVMIALPLKKICVRPQTDLEPTHEAEKRFESQFQNL
jgi:hypothetical protein